MRVTTLLFASLLAPAHAMSVEDVEKHFQPARGCAIQLVALARDVEKTRDVKTRRTAANKAVKPATIAGLEYLNQLVGRRGTKAGKVKACETAFARLVAGPAKALFDRTALRPGGPVERGRAALKSVRVHATALQTVPRMRLSAVNGQIAGLRKQAGAFLGVINAMRTVAQRKRAQLGKGTSPSGAARHFTALRTCASKIATLGTDMKRYRDRRFRGKPANHRVRPRDVVAGRNIDDVVKAKGWLARCKAETARVAQVPMSRALPGGFLKPHHGGWARMKTALAELRVTGAFLSGKGRLRLDQVDRQLKAFRKSAGDLLGKANDLQRHASSLRN